MNLKHLKPAVLSIGIISLCIINGAQFEIQASPQDDVSAAKQFVGMWKLVTWRERLNDGTTRSNPASVAYLTYTDTGHMCFVAMDPNRPKWKSASTPTPEEMASGLARGAFYAYCGIFDVNAKEGFIVHHMEIEKSPNLVGTVRKRWFKFQGPNRLELKVDQPQSPVIESTLVWVKIQK